MSSYYLILISFLISLSACASKQAEAPVQAAATTSTTTTTIPTTALQNEKTNLADEKDKETKKFLNLAAYCEKSLSAFPGKHNAKALAKACAQVQIMKGCESVEGSPIFHFNQFGDSKKISNILVFSLIHGDETPAGSVGRFWMERLVDIMPRNNWRVVPILNPDGVARKTRTNANEIDVNRNFPTRDWTEKAIPYWKRDSKSNPRRFPGHVAASEPETLCALKHIEDFKPDFIVSIHTPLKVLDFDGPKVKPPKFDYLPWKSLGHYPGSLGRYMWFERQVPVLTMELKEDLPNSNDPWLQLQDIIGVLVGLENMPDKEKSK